MTEPTARQAIDLRPAFDSTMAVLRRVGPDDLGKPTPCESWDVRALINHIVRATRFWAAAISGDAGLTAGIAEPAAGDFVAAYERAIGVALDAYAAQGAATRIVRVHFGVFPGRLLQGFAAADQFVHGWDLARALGHDTDLAPDLAVALLALAEEAIDDSVRDPGRLPLFARPRPAPAGATAADRLAAFLGREV